MQEITSQSIERNRILKSLIQEVLGPRSGPYESLDATFDPTIEYITGILEHRYGNSEFTPTPETDDSNIAIEGSHNTGDMDDDTPHLSAAGDYDSKNNLLSPLDFRNFPQSMGLSFVLESNNNSSIEILVTYAKYNREEHSFKRDPKFWVSEKISLTEEDQTFVVNDEIEIKIIVSKLTGQDNSKNVSIFLVNGLEGKGIADEIKKDRSSRCVFQPQIRVVLGESTRLVQLGKYRDETMSSEEKSLGAPFRDLNAYAKGYLCGAVWKEVDYEESENLYKSADDSAYFWIDGSILPGDLRSKFTKPHIRTDYIPSYHVGSPDMEWDYDQGEPPVLQSELLADMFDPDQLYNALIPLVSAYRNWIAKQKETLNPDDDYHDHDIEAVYIWEDMADRIQSGIDLLRADKNVRLAFCFANKSISLQSKWGHNKESLIWRPFQLAFILINLKSLADEDDEFRDICDVLWFPTGGGKTEAYLALMAFVLGFNRIVRKGKAAGVNIISRYTLRLLTIQQFRRTARMVTACELLRSIRNRDGTVGWNPDPNENANYVWGRERFSIGLWVGGNVTPNNLSSTEWFQKSGRGGRHLWAGAIDLLRGAARDYEGPERDLQKKASSYKMAGDESEPVQILNCPACDNMLSIPDEGLSKGKYTIYLTVRFPRGARMPNASAVSTSAFKVTNLEVLDIINGKPENKIIVVNFSVDTDRDVKDSTVDNWFEKDLKPKLGSETRILSVRASRMGYFLTYIPREFPTHFQDFMVFCPNPGCPLSDEIEWQEEVPYPLVSVDRESNEVVMGWQTGVEAFQKATDSSITLKVPIPVYTVDSQIYARCPSIVIATVDKFARLAYEPQAGSLFGQVDYYNVLAGYYRKGVPPNLSQGFGTKFLEHPSAAGSRKRQMEARINVENFDPPTLIIQDELHLIEGPLGSMVGAYETVIDELSSFSGRKPKYIASSATIKSAEDQVKSLFNRGISVFPPQGLRVTDNFFSRSFETSPDTNTSGRLYVGLACFGHGSLNPLVRIWSRLLQKVFEDLKDGVPDEICDPYWTVVGYFNSIKDLAGVSGMLRQNIQERLQERYTNPREIQFDVLEVSSRTKSSELPVLLNNLERSLPQEAENAMLTTSIFGTGVDVGRLGLMVMHDQPKTGSAYIQATGRVGRNSPGLVITVLRPNRPRDRGHYEFFLGYHRALHRWVEPVTVAPFSSRAMQKTFGPIQVALLRTSGRIGDADVSGNWRIEQRLKQRLGERTYHSMASMMASERGAEAVRAMENLLEYRSQQQPENRRPTKGKAKNIASSELDKWNTISLQHSGQNDLLYNETSMNNTPEHPVVLGDPAHKSAGQEEVYENAPNSLRDVESSTGFKIE